MVFVFGNGCARTEVGNRLVSVGVTRVLCNFRLSALWGLGGGRRTSDAPIGDVPPPVLRREHKLQRP